MNSLAADLVRSAFCGPRRQENRVPVFVAAADETTGATHRDPFMRCGFLAPEDHWTSLTAQWDERVLVGPPRILYLHVADIRSPKWLTQHCLSDADAVHRVDEAFKVIGNWPSLTPLSMTVDSGHLYDTYTDKFVLASGAKKKFLPDHLAFSSYAYMTLAFCQLNRPEAEKVHFVVEKNGEITNHIEEF